MDITIAAGATTGFADVTITPEPDRVDENDETVTIGAAASGGLSVTGADVTITDDDNRSRLVTLSVDTDTDAMGEQTDIGEGDGATSVLVTATLNDAVRSDATVVELTFTAGSAVAGSTEDYVPSGTLQVTIPANEVSGHQTITITPNDERIDDGDKTITIGALPTSGLGIVSAPSITLEDNDDAPTAIELTVDPTSVREQGPAGGSGLTTSVEITASFTGANSDVTLLNDTGVTLSVHSTSTAMRGTDYTAPAALGDGTADITIPKGHTSASTTIDFTSIQDVVSEGTETIVIDGAATNFTVASTDRATINFTDDDSASESLTLLAFECVEVNVGMPCNDAVVSDIGESGDASTFKIFAELDGNASASAVVVTLSILTPDGVNNAIRGDDYTVSGIGDATTMDITIPANSRGGCMRNAAGRCGGTAFAEVTLTPQPDTVDEDDEVVRISGSTTTATILRVNTHDIAILDDDTASTSVRLTKSSGLDSFTEDHGAGVPYQIVATLDGNVSREADTPVTVSFGGSAAVGDGCATAGVDFTVSPSPVVITIAAEALTGDASVTVTPCNPAGEGGLGDPEPTEAIVIGGTADFGGTIGVVDVASGFTVSLVDDDLPIVTLTAERVSPEGPDDSVREGASATFRITASRDTGQTTQRVVVPLAVLDDSTADRDDYTLGLGSITIPANGASATRNVTLSTRQDQAVEGDETVVVGGQVGDGSEFSVSPVTFTITDDDVESTEVRLSVSRSSLPERAGRTRVTVTAELDAAPWPVPDDGGTGNDVVVTLSSPLGGTATAGEDKDYILGSSDARDDHDPRRPDPGHRVHRHRPGAGRHRRGRLRDDHRDRLADGQPRRQLPRRGPPRGRDARVGARSRDHRRRCCVEGHRVDRGPRPGRGRQPVIQHRRGRRRLSHTGR